MIRKHIYKNFLLLIYIILKQPYFQRFQIKATYKSTKEANDNARADGSHSNASIVPYAG